MAKRKLSLLVQAMNIFAQLDERDRQTLVDYVRSQTVTTRPKSAAPSAVKKSKARIAAGASGQSIEDVTENVSGVGANGS